MGIYETRLLLRQKTCYKTAVCNTAGILEKNSNGVGIRDIKYECDDMAYCEEFAKGLLIGQL